MSNVARETVQTTDQLRVYVGVHRVGVWV